MRRAVFVTATDTDIGKTMIASALVVGMRERGIRCGVMKPVQCAGNDALFLKRVSGAGDPLGIINPFSFRRPLSPHLAARLESRHISLKKILRCYEMLRERHDFLVVEGAGGLLVPLSGRMLVADMIKALDLDIVIVARAGLGTINHTLLTIEAAARRNIRIVGIVYNQSTRGPLTVCEEDNPVIIRKLSAIRTLGLVPFRKIQRGRVSVELLRDIAGRIDIDAIVGDSPAQRERARDVAGRNVQPIAPHRAMAAARRNAGAREE